MFFLETSIAGIALSAIPVLIGRGVARAKRRAIHSAALAAIAALSLILGALVFASHAGYVTAERALLGAALAAVFGSAIPLALYFELGYRVRSRIGLACLWPISGAPLIYYLFVVFLLAGGLVQCTPGQYECPI